MLNQRLADARRGDTSSDALAAEAAAADVGTARSNSDDPLNRSSAQQDQQQQQGGEKETASSSAFTRSTDDDFADALNRRIGEVAGSLASDDEEDRAVLTGQWSAYRGAGSLFHAACVFGATWSRRWWVCTTVPVCLRCP